MESDAAACEERIEVIDQRVWPVVMVNSDMLIADGPKLGPALITYLSLLSCLYDSDFSIDGVAARVGISLGTALEHLQQLENLGWIRRNGRNGFTILDKEV